MRTSESEVLATEKAKREAIIEIIKIDLNIDRIKLGLSLGIYLEMADSKIKVI